MDVLILQRVNLCDFLLDKALDRVPFLGFRAVFMGF